MAQPGGLSPQSLGLTLEQTILGGILVDFQAGELVSPAHKLYIHFNKSYDMIREWIVTGMHRIQVTLIKIFLVPCLTLGSSVIQFIR